MSSYIRTTEAMAILNAQHRANRLITFYQQLQTKFKCALKIVTVFTVTTSVTNTHGLQIVVSCLLGLSGYHIVFLAVAYFKV